jgi:Tfp pilus assembly protein PilO
VKQKKPLPKAVLVALPVVAGLVIAAAGWLLAISPQRSKATDLRRQTAAVQQKISDELAQAARAKSAASAPEIQVADVYKLAKAMPGFPDMPDVLLELDQTAKAAGVQLDSISPAAPAPATAGGYSTLGLSLAVEGDFYTVTDLLYRLRNLVFVRNGALEANGRLFSVDNVSLTPSTGRGLKATVAVQTYVFGGGPTAPSAAVSATSTTATTTTTTASSSGPSAAGAP